LTIAVWQLANACHYTLGYKLKHLAFFYGSVMGQLKGSGLAFATLSKIVLFLR